MRGHYGGGGALGLWQDSAVHAVRDRYSQMAVASCGMVFSMSWSRMHAVGALPHASGGLDGGVLYFDTEGAFRPDR